MKIYRFDFFCSSAQEIPIYILQGKFDKQLHYPSCNVLAVFVLSEIKFPFSSTESNTLMGDICPVSFVMCWMRVLIR